MYFEICNEKAINNGKAYIMYIFIGWKKNVLYRHSHLITL